MRPGVIQLPRVQLAGQAAAAPQKARARISRAVERPDKARVVALDPAWRAAAAAARAARDKPLSGMRLEMAEWAFNILFLRRLAARRRGGLPAEGLEDEALGWGTSAVQVGLAAVAITKWPGWRIAGAVAARMPSVVLAL